MIRQEVKDLYFIAIRGASFPAYVYYKIKHSLSNKGHYKVHLGSGPHYIDGMINIDGNPFSRKDMWLDLRRKLPFGNGSCDLIYMSHVLEHFYPVQALRLLEEIHRVLAPDGVARVAVPGFEHALKVARGEAFSTWPRKFDDPLSQAINYIFCDGQHRYAYTLGTITSLAGDAGFEVVRDVSNDVERVYFGISLGNEPEGSLVVELAKRKPNFIDAA